MVRQQGGAAEHHVLHRGRGSGLLNTVQVAPGVCLCLWCHALKCVFVSAAEWNRAHAPVFYTLRILKCLPNASAVVGSKSDWTDHMIKRNKYKCLSVHEGRSVALTYSLFWSINSTTLRLSALNYLGSVAWTCRVYVTCCFAAEQIMTRNYCKSVRCDPWALVYANVRVEKHFRLITKFQQNKLGHGLVN